MQNGPWLGETSRRAFRPPILSFDGIPYPGVVCFCAPPDTNGEVGATQYVQIVNGRATRSLTRHEQANTILGPASINSVWAGLWRRLPEQSQGDPVMLYDQDRESLADQPVLGRPDA